MKKKTNPKKRSSAGPTKTVSNRKKKSASKRKPSKTSSATRSISKEKNKKIRKTSTKKATSSIRRKTSTKKAGRKTKARVISKTKGRSVAKHRIVRIMGEGQFTVDNSTMKRLNMIDDSIVQLVSTGRSDDDEFRKRLTELTDIVQTKGRPLDPKEIIESDIILPSTDLSIDEAVSLFRGEGVIPDTAV